MSSLDRKALLCDWIFSLLITKRIGLERGDTIFLVEGEFYGVQIWAIKAYLIDHGVDASLAETMHAIYAIGESVGQLLSIS